jgi:hypothetical protein
VSRVRFIDGEKANHLISLMCRLLDVSRSGFTRGQDGRRLSVNSAMRGCLTGPGRSTHRTVVFVARRACTLVPARSRHPCRTQARGADHARARAVWADSPVTRTTDSSSYNALLREAVEPEQFVSLAFGHSFFAAREPELIHGRSDLNATSCAERSSTDRDLL